MENSIKVGYDSRRKTTEEAAENYGWSIKRNIFSNPIYTNLNKWFEQFKKN